MDRKNFLGKTLAGLGALLSIPMLSGSNNQNNQSDLACESTPRETRGPFPIKSPKEFMRENIVSDRTGIPLEISIQVQDSKKGCRPCPGIHVDIWHCDKDGYYSEYGDHRYQRKNLKDVHFLRGRQVTDANGKVKFTSIYPGWYPGRAPHLHIELKDGTEKSLLVTQIAFPESTSEQVYSAGGYRGSADTTNQRDGVFRDSLAHNMADKVTGNSQDGFRLNKLLVI